MNCFVTGAAGFIGSNLTDRLLASGHSVVGYDNFSTGLQPFLQNALEHESFRFIEADTLDLSALNQAMRDAEFVFHIAANADVRFGVNHPRKDLEQNVLATWNVLESMRNNGIRRIVFASTGSVYGEPTMFPTPEYCPFPVQTSLYGASKVAAEGFIQAYAEAFNIQAYIFRFVSILGERYSHGHVFDFYKQLLDHPDKLYILGNGLQRKSYLYVHDCIDAILLAAERAADQVNIFNLGTDSHCDVNQSVAWICRNLGLNPELSYAGGERGWIGDSPYIFLDCRHIQELGWRPKVSIEEAVVRTIEYLKQNRWILTARA